MLSAMEYPHWLMVAGAVMVALGFIGLTFRRNRDVEPDRERAEMKANGKQDGRDSNAATLPPWPWRPPPQAR
jgi:LPXTG-motif cell wall-anchored protein